jgi:hypothetical protein
LQIFATFLRNLNCFLTTNVKIYSKELRSTLGLIFNFICNRRSDGMAELANMYVVHFRDPDSNLGTDRKYFLILFVLHLNSNACLY